MSHDIPAMVRRLLDADRVAHDIEDRKRTAPPPMPELTSEQMAAADETMEFVQ